MNSQRQNFLKTLLLLALFVSYQAGVTLFVHTHVVDGVAVAHSHPFSSSNHSHSSLQIVAIGQLSTFNGVEHASYDEIKVYHNGVEEIEISNHESNVVNLCAACILLRAPPMCC